MLEGDRNVSFTVTVRNEAGSAIFRATLSLAGKCWTTWSSFKSLDEHPPVGQSQDGQSSIGSLGLGDQLTCYTPDLIAVEVIAFGETSPARFQFTKSDTLLNRAPLSS